MSWSLISFVIILPLFVVQIFINSSSFKNYLFFNKFSFRLFFNYPHTPPNPFIKLFLRLEHSYYRHQNPEKCPPRRNQRMNYRPKHNGLPLILKFYMELHSFTLSYFGQQKIIDTL